MKIAVISRQGLGDGLLMMICARHLKNIGKVTFFHRLFHELSNFFPGYEFKELSNDEDFTSYDLILLEHYKSPLVQKILDNRKNLNLHVIYPTYKKERELLSKNDFVCESKKSMAQNLMRALEKILKKTNISKTNGLVIPKGLSFQKFEKRVILHPVSTDKLKNWRKNRFIKLYYKLQKRGFDPWICLASHEKKTWEKENLNIFSAQNFHELAAFIYESLCLIGNDSGPAHLASNLNIPFIVIASSARTMRLWKPDFYEGRLITASKLIPNCFFCRLRNRYWSYFISVSKVLKSFDYLMRKISLKSTLTKN